MQTNYSTAIMLFNPNVRAIEVAYNPLEEEPNQTLYTFKSLNKDIQVGDLVVVPTGTRHGYTVVKVVEVDVEVDIESTIQLLWIVSRLDLAANDAVLGEEKKWIADLKQAEARKKREEIKASMQETYDDAEGGLDASLIATMGSDVLLLEATTVDSSEETLTDED